MRERVTFDAPASSEDVYGKAVDGWSEQFSRAAEFRYEHGREAEQAGRLTGTARFKVRIAQSAPARAITTEYRMRDTRRSVAYNVREVDVITDRRWIWIVVEGGVAV